MSCEFRNGWMRVGSRRWYLQIRWWFPAWLALVAFAGFMAWRG